MIQLYGQSLNILLCQYLSSLFLNEFTVGADVTCSGRLFQGFTTSTVKLLCLSSVLTLASGALGIDLLIMRSW